MRLSTDDLIDLLRMRIARMEPDARLKILNDIMEGYCSHCGGPGGHNCQCWNDE